MKFPKKNFARLKYPLKLLLLGNEDTWHSMWDVVSDLKPGQLSYKFPKYEHRSIAEMINHALEVQYGFYTKTLVLGGEYKELKLKKPQNAKQAQKNILNVYTKTVNLWKSLKEKDFKKKIKTEWGQVLIGELALFQSITHTHYHLSEICFLRGLGGFPTKAMG